MFIQISDPSVLVNNVAVAIVPNSLTFDEGLGEQNVLVQSAGGGQLQQVYANDVATNLGMVKFSLQATKANIDLARSWKSSQNRNVVTITAANADGTLTRSFTNAAICNAYEVPLSADGVIELEFKGDAPTT